MYIHIGSSIMVTDSSIVGIFDLDGEVTRPDTKAFLKNADKKGISSLAGDDLPRSFVVTSSKKDGDRVIFSRLTTQALAKRAHRANNKPKDEIYRDLADTTTQEV